MDQTPTFQWANEAIPLSLPSKFILPNPIRPDRTCVSHLYSIPIIDMGTDNEAQLIQGITSACKGFGFFQVINHGIPLELCKNVLDMITKLLHLPYEEKSHLVTTTHLEDGKIFKYYVKDQQTQEKISMWAESFFHTWHPHDHGFTHNLPNNPPQCRSVIATYAKEVGSPIVRLLGLISQGLGLERDYLKKKLGEIPSYTAQANYCPPCPNPELTLGLPAHTDYNVLTIFFHVLKDGNWVAVDSLPGALIVLSNDRYKSVYHRAVTNKKKKGVSLAMFVGPNYDTVVGPIKESVDESHPPLYRSNTRVEFVHKFRNQEGKPRKRRSGEIGRRRCHLQKG
ncbi:hypothetical protein Cgig2_001814 [Carnegiea gigantea]|uniref:Fe2OG dioxygenase domain-containing protein n=1 Tax=Carnegiea gigantea TaxID=171969 RepID=A0A9Q1GKQ3_9CARY|nr:hypothetical protein Cgig2_001814 [Carnegiea gigantea]